MATGLESAFDQQEGEDVFAVEEGASTGYRSEQDAFLAGLELSREIGKQAYIKELKKRRKKQFKKLSKKDQEIFKDFTDTSLPEVYTDTRNFSRGRGVTEEQAQARSWVASPAYEYISLNKELKQVEKGLKDIKDIDLTKGVIGG